MFVSSSVLASLEFWSVNQTSIYEHFELKIFRSIKFLDKLSNNWSEELFGTNLSKINNLADNHCYSIQVISLFQVLKVLNISKFLLHVGAILNLLWLYEFWYFPTRNIY